MSRTASPRRGRRVAVGVVAVAAAGGLTAGGIALARDDGAAPTPSEQTAVASTGRTTTVERRDLVDTVDAEGTLGYGDPRPVRGAGAGTVTALPEAGAIVEVDRPLYSVDGHDGPIVLPGALPMWRTLEAGVDDGADVAQLEAALAALGYADPDMTVDEEMTWLTTEAIEAWQEAHGLEETGRVEPGAVWFATDPVRVASTTAKVGDPAQGEIVAVTGTTRSVGVDMDVADSEGVAVGDAVELELADGSSATGVVGDVADVATVTPASGQDPATTTVAVEITPDEELAAPDQSPVTVSFVSDAVEDVLAVPLEAIVATAEGGFALEVVSPGGGTDLVPVELGRLADGWVQVTATGSDSGSGSISEGTEVVTA